MMHHVRDRAACPVAADENDVVCNRRIAWIGEEEVKDTACFRIEAR